MMMRCKWTNLENPMDVDAREVDIIGPHTRTNHYITSMVITPSSNIDEA
jgi:hypothetical protein